LPWNFGKYGDFSYGVYIIHFPVIQLLVNARWLQDSPWQFFAVVALITGTGAIALWHLVEKRFLLRASHYITSTN
jgi:peptidoglycan/LPS O-acetylase OafA/YrhL